MSVLNVRVDSELKKRLKNLGADAGRPISRIVKELLEERLLIEEAAKREDWPVPEWVPVGKYVALVKGGVVAVGDSPSDVLDEALSKFAGEAVQVKMRGRRTPRFQYAFLAKPGIDCWRYVVFGDDEYPVVPCTLVGVRRVGVGGMPDSGASISLASGDLIRRAGLRRVRREVVQTGGGAVKMEVFAGRVEVIGREYGVKVGEVDLPREFPVKLLLGRNVLDSLDTYLLGKSRVLCVKDL